MLIVMIRSKIWKRRGICLKEDSILSSEDFNKLQSKKKIEDFIYKETSFRRKGNEETIILTDFVVDDGKISLKAKLETEYNSFIKQYGLDVVIGIYYLFLFVTTVKYTFNLIASISWLDLDLLKFNYYSLSFFLITPVLVWLISTNTIFWNYHINKISTLYFVCIATTLRLAGMIYVLAYEFFIPSIGRIEVTEEITLNMILGLGYLSTIIPTFISCVLIYSSLRGLFKRDNKKEILEFKLRHYVDLSKRDPYEYEMAIVTDMETGKKVVVSEKDRMVHTETTGATGTAKTSSCITTAVNDDLDTKIRNEDAQKKVLLKMVQEGKAYITKPFNDKDFSVNYFKPNPGYEEMFKKKVLRYRSAGITVIAPDDSLTDSIYELCELKGVRCHRIDPKPLPDGSLKPGFIGFNPLYISPSMPEWVRKKEIIKKATLFADVMQLMYEMSGKSDPYFSSINRIATTTVSILLSLTYPLLHDGKQPTPEDVQILLNDFSRIQEYYTKLLEIDVHGEYTVISDIIKDDFLGKGQEEFRRHCRGLRVQLNNFLFDPLIKTVLCSQNSIDLDRALENGEVTVCNIELGDLGPINSPAFGLFFSISFLNAVLRRPGTEFTRLPHFWYIDELPVIISPALESCFSLFRKFRVAMFVALQTFDQMNKNPFLQYLKGVILNSCGHHIIFGRANPEDMELFSQLGGKKIEYMEQETISQTALSLDQPSYSESTRTTPTLENILEPHDIRNKDFQEVTFFTVEKGRPLKPIHGRVFFLREKDKKPKKRFRVNWEELILNQTVITRNEVEKIHEETEKKVDTSFAMEVLENAIKESTITLENNESSESIEILKTEVTQSMITSEAMGIENMSLLEEDISDNSIAGSTKETDMPREDKENEKIGQSEECIQSEVKVEEQNIRESSKTSDSEKNEESEYVMCFSDLLD